MKIEFKHDDLPQEKTFTSPEEVVAWAKAESAFWASLKTSGSSAAEAYVRKAQTALQRLTSASTKPDDDQAIAAALRSLQSEVPYLYTGSHGQLLASMRALGRDEKAIMIALSMMLKPEETRGLVSHNNYWIYDGIVGIAHVAAMEAGGDPQRLHEFLATIDRSTSEFKQEVEIAKTENARVKQEYADTMQELHEGVVAADTSVTASAAKFETALSEIKSKFEEQFALRTPMTYWREKADRHQKAATNYRRWFSGLLGVGLLGFVVIAYVSLFPFLAVRPNAYWALILFSVGVAIWAWPLRLASKLYLTHTQLFEDAAEREVIARTFLALGEQVKLSDGDRQLLLGALLRPASISLASDDSGLNVADIILAKTLTKS